MIQHTILIIEDSLTSQTILRGILQQAGYHVISAASGAEARTIFTATPITAILLDLILPDLSGYDLFREIRQLEDTKLVPVIMLTQRRSHTEQDYGTLLGADAYITKPFEDELLLDTLERVITNSGTAHKIS